MHLHSKYSKLTAASIDCNMLDIDAVTCFGPLKHQQQSSCWGKARKERYSSDTKESSHDSDQKEEGNIYIGKTNLLCTRKKRSIRDYKHSFSVVVKVSNRRFCILSYTIYVHMIIPSWRVTFFKLVSRRHYGSVIVYSDNYNGICVRYLLLTMCHQLG